MRFYKIVNNGVVESIEARSSESTDSSMIEIDETEYCQLRAKFAEEWTKNAESESSEQSKDERIAELEKENAALLFQMLTGEEYTDV